MDLAPGLKTEAASRSPRDMAQRHGGFLRSSIALAHIAAEAGRGHVLPGVTTSPTAGHHMVDGQLIVTTAAVLASVVVTLEEIATREGQLTKWNADVLPQANDSR